MIVYVAEAHAHFQRLILVVKMATVLEEYPTEEQRSVVFFTSKYFLFTVGSVCRAKRFTAESRNVANVSLMTKSLKRSCTSG
jgi:hypothetical protein